MNSTPEEPSPELVAVAYHEAGHAVVALALGRPIQRVSIQPNQLRQGYVTLKKGSFKPSHDALETETLILLGGPAAEARKMGRFCWQGATQDLRGVRALMQTRSGSPRQAERMERRMLDKTEHVLDQPGAWEAVEAIAQELLRSTIMSGRAAQHLYNQAVARAEREG